jgi:hypothetical protein
MALLRGLAALATVTTLVGCAPPPRLPEAEPGAMPRWADRYGAWTAKAETPVYADERDTSRLAFTLRPGDRVEALTGTMHTLAYGHIRFFQGGEVYRPGSDEPIKLWPFEEVVLLERVSEESWSAWVRGEPHEFVMSACDGGWHTELELPVQAWWVQLRDGRGRTGWTPVTTRDQFDGIRER